MSISKYRTIRTISALSLLLAAAGSIVALSGCGGGGGGASSSASPAAQSSYPLSGTYSGTYACTSYPDQGISPSNSSGKMVITIADGACSGTAGSMGVSGTAVDGGDSLVTCSLRIGNANWFVDAGNLTFNSATGALTGTLSGAWYSAELGEIGSNSTAVNLTHE